jgi:SAM-dependent methyltransferase
MPDFFTRTIQRAFHPTFFGKTLLYAVTPGGFGHYRKLRNKQDPNYVHERDKHPLREKHHGAGGWKDAIEDGVRRRDYATYDEYLTHQKLKLEELLKTKGGFTNTDILNFRLKFYRRFRHLPGLLPREANILCCGARQGTEVEVLRDLGFANARGIDLNPGEDNPWVRPGDFMHLDESDNSLDLLYTNCVDHAFDLDALFKEHARAIKPDGYVLYELGANMEGGGGPFESVAWERTEDVFQTMLGIFGQIIRVERDQEWLWILMRGKR